MSVSLTRCECLIPPEQRPNTPTKGDSPSMLRAVAVVFTAGLNTGITHTHESPTAEQSRADARSLTLGLLVAAHATGQLWHLDPTLLCYGALQNKSSPAVSPFIWPNPTSHFHKREFGSSTVGTQPPHPQAMLPSLCRAMPRAACGHRLLIKGPGISHVVSDALARCPGSSGSADSVGSGAVPVPHPGSPHGAEFSPSTLVREAAPPPP